MTLKARCEVSMVKGAYFALAVNSVCFGPTKQIVTDCEDRAEGKQILKK